MKKVCYNYAVPQAAQQQVTLQQLEMAVMKPHLAAMCRVTPQEISQCRLFWQGVITHERYRTLIRGLDADSIACANRVLARTRLVAMQQLKPGQNCAFLDIYTPEEQAELEVLRKEFHQQILPLEEGIFAWRHYLMPDPHLEASVLYYRLQLHLLRHHERFAGRDIIDAGANYGDSAALLSGETTGRVIAFEPVSRIYDLLCRTIKINGLHNVTLVRAALGAKTEKASIKVAGGGFNPQCRTRRLLCRRHRNRPGLHAR